jgi:carbohydrate-binding DOMON domain-containing protein
MAIGEAAGTAAALAVRAGVAPRDVDVVALRQTLQDAGALV